MNIARAERIAWFGDSLSAGFGAGTASVLATLAPLIRGQYGGPSVPQADSLFRPPVSKWPTLVVDALAGRATAGISGTMATVLANMAIPATAAVVQLGINDAAAINAATLTVPTFSAQTLAIVDAIASTWGLPYSRIMWIGPWGHDSGDFAVQIAQVDASLATNAALRGFQLVRWSDIPNTIPTNSPVDGTHPNSAGAALLAARVMAGLTFTN